MSAPFQRYIARAHRRADEAYRSALREYAAGRPGRCLSGLGEALELLNVADRVEAMQRSEAERGQAQQRKAHGPVIP